MLAVGAYPAARDLSDRVRTVWIDSCLQASTVTGHLDLLHDVGLQASLPPWTPNLAKREIGRPKTLVVDSAVALRLARLTADQLAAFEYGEAALWGLQTG